MKTKTLFFSGNCLASYSGSMEVPADLTLENAIEYAIQHFSSENIETELEYVGISKEKPIIDKKKCIFEMEPIATIDELIETIKHQTDWKVTKEDDEFSDGSKRHYLVFESLTPAGENFYIEIDYPTEKSSGEQIKEIINQIYETYVSYDIDRFVMEYLETLIVHKKEDEQFAEVPDIEALLKDATAINTMLLELSITLKDLPVKEA